MRDVILLNHISVSIECIQSYTGADRDGFFGSPQVQDAVVRNIEIISEATKHLCTCHIRKPEARKPPGARDTTIPRVALH